MRSFTFRVPESGCRARLEPRDCRIVCPAESGCRQSFNGVADGSDNEVLPVVASLPGPSSGPSSNHALVRRGTCAHWAGIAGPAEPGRAARSPRPPGRAGLLPRSPPRAGRQPQPTRDAPERSAGSDALGWGGAGRMAAGWVGESGMSDSRRPHGLALCLAKVQQQADVGPVDGRHRRRRRQP